MPPSRSDADVSTMPPESAPNAGEKRAAGGYSQNPTVQAYIGNAQSLHIQGSHALNAVRGNSRT